MSQTTTPTSTPTAPAEKARLAATAISDIAAAFTSPAGEARNTAISHALASTGTALAAFGIAGLQPWLTAAGIALGIAPTLWKCWDDWRAARAVQRAIEAGATEAFATHAAAVQAATSAKGVAQ